MHMTIAIGDRLLPLVAPVGAACYSVNQQDDRVTILFGMMQAGENGHTAILRIRKAISGVDWKAVAMNPTLQRVVAQEKGDFVRYDMKQTKEGFVGATAAMLDFLSMVYKLQKTSAQAPKALFTKFEGWQSASRPTSREKEGQHEGPS